MLLLRKMIPIVALDINLQSHHSMHSPFFRVGERDLFACFLSDKFSSRHIIKLFGSKLTFLGLRIRLEPANLGITRDQASKRRLIAGKFRK